MTTFQSLGLSKPILKSLDVMGFEETTPIQEQTIPLGLEGKDVIGQAQTGTGKTAAFGIPMLEKINKQVKAVQGLVIAPTRELAIQVAEELNRLGKGKGIRVLPIYGGSNMERQIRALKNNHIVVATPGRLLDHIRRKTIKLEDVHTAVLDEADEMLNMGFIEDIRDILKALPEERQTLLFSATMPKEIRDIATTLMNNPEEVKVKAKEMTVENIEQFFVEIPEKHKFDTLTRLLDIHDPALAIVFGRTKRRVDEVADGLQARGFSAEGIHGDLTQGKRMSTLNKFKRGRIEILVATDVAARGLDISDVSHVYNFDIPQDPESYVHRIGRTGRAGRKGKSISFVTPREKDQLHLIEKLTKKKVERLKVPSSEEAARGQQKVAVEKLAETITNNDLKNYKQAANELLEQYESTDLIAAALKMMTKERSEVPVRLSSVQPISVKNAQRDKSKKKGGYRKGGGGKRNFNSKNKSRNRNFSGKGGSKRGNYQNKGRS
ncbi:DEAD/DEAH box helicase [Halobacillus litoralis]|uniref:DEAD/DEAH box helicase n=1 Tax=Halobacillus TaxID=45667 RepID=UPI001A8DF4D2|nr:MULTISPECIES: DEAD/DEAH box helicase [Halobacillus]MBN9656182.1 DEAD/DEAH box helicase [Halobacillus sp. GSS1]MEC3882448.1 DEAD/DEAH box helicase [Halobacillus sp. HZG1]WLR48179.1 DEAD/DEAH box helicase [Halobacillus litoralis]